MYAGLQDIFTLNRKGNIRDDVCGDLSCSLILFLVLRELDFIVCLVLLVIETCSH